MTCIGGAVIVTVAVADLLGSATLVAVTEPVPGVLLAVNVPSLATVPPVAVQLTAVFVVLATVAVNFCVAPA